MGDRGKFIENVKISDFWNDIPWTKNLLNAGNLTNPPEFFRFSLDELDRTLGYTLNATQLDNDFREQSTIVTNRESLPYILDLRGQAQSTYNCPALTGWIYIFSNILELAAGRCEEGMWWWHHINYKCRLKIGRTYRHPVQRIAEQSKGSGLARPIVPLGMFWSFDHIQADHRINNRLQEYQVRNVPGIEWYELEPSKALNIIHSEVIKEPVRQNDLTKEKSVSIKK